MCRPQMGQVTPWLYCSSFSACSFSLASPLEPGGQRTSPPICFFGFMRSVLSAEQAFEPAFEAWLWLVRGFDLEPSASALVVVRVAFGELRVSGDEAGPGERG